MAHVLTAQAGALPLALEEAGNPAVRRKLEPGVVLCESAVRPERPVFLRHLCPAEVEVPLDGTADDLGRLAAALSPMIQRLSAESSFSVQTRIIEGFQPGYKRFDVNAALSSAALGSGAPLDVKKPKQIISVTLAQGAGWIGLSTPEENISDWAGGERRFKWEVSQISRAEFKLLETIETFGISLKDGDHALDLGAAPGGWTRVLRQRGLYVTAVDPAELDPRLMRDKRVTHYRGTAQAYFRNPKSCDLMVNDMKMDSEQSASLMAEGAGCLTQGGGAVLTLKLPDKVEEWLPRVRRAEAILREAYQIIGIRQLFHNRNEVTAYLTRL